MHCYAVVALGFERVVFKVIKG
ncbi:hypothetical protein CCP3SC15_1320007 [Gammaproteobacteria bacterium]